MSKQWLGRAMLAALTGVGLASCTLISGVGDLTVDDAAIDAAMSDGAHPNLPDAKGNGNGDGQVDGSGPLTDGDTSDAPLLGDPDATIIEACSPTGCLSLPAGFQLVAYGAATSGCPANFGTPTTALTNPSLAAGACSCKCDVTTLGNCAQTASVPSSYGDVEAGVCPNAGDIYTGGCAADGYLGPFTSDVLDAFSPPKAGPFNGSCTPGTKMDTSKVGGTTVRVCQATAIPKCNDKVCPSDPGSGYNACIAANGDVACPAPDWPIKHLVGSTPTFSCAVGSCACGAEQAFCSGKGKFNFYNQVNCGGNPAATFIADGQCHHAPPEANNTFVSHKYVADPPANPSCPASGAPAPSGVSLSQLLTVCCTK